MEDKFRYSICEPLNPEIIEKEHIAPTDIIRTFETFPWDKYLEEMENVDESAIYYSPSLEFENLANKHGITASAVGIPGNYEFYVFYKRPKRVKRLFGLINTIDMNYQGEKTDQTAEDVINCLNALIRDDIDFLEQKFKQGLS